MDNTPEIQNNQDQKEDVQIQKLYQILIGLHCKRNFYLEKFRKIEKLGNHFDWNDQSGLLAKIKDYLDKIE